jgi:hypothetical protein
MFFYLAMSASTILSSSTGVDILNGFLQLFEEWEYYIAGPAMQSMKFVLAKNSSCMYPALNTSNEESEQIRPPFINKFNNTVVYEHLIVTQVPFKLDYVEVFIGLCDSLALLYDKFVYDEFFM